VNWSALEAAEVPPAVDTVTSTVPDPEGVVAEHEVSETQVATPAGDPPKATVEGPTTNPAPVMVTTVPPASGPAAGETAVTAGIDS
jgi:hypothetical protein